MSNDQPKIDTEVRGLDPEKDKGITRGARTISRYEDVAYSALEREIPESLGPDSIVVMAAAHADIFGILRDSIDAGELDHKETEFYKAMRLYTNKVILREQKRFRKMLRQEHARQEKNGTRLPEVEFPHAEQQKAGLHNVARTFGYLMDQIGKQEGYDD